MTPPPSPWLVGRPRPEASLRLFCFPWAGGSPAAFLPWQRHLPSSLELWGIQLPGRGPRLREVPSASFTEVTRALTDAIAPYADRPFAFFGHSLGALVAFELARRLRDAALPLPNHLIVSAAMAPSVPRQRMRPEDLDDTHLIAALKGYGGTPDAALQDPQLLELVLPALRGDFTLLDGYQYRSSAPLPLPLTVFAGRDDTRAAPEKLAAWRSETTHFRAVHWFDGGHFYLQGSAAPSVVQRIEEILLHSPTSDREDNAGALSENVRDGAQDSI